MSEDEADADVDSMNDLEYLMWLIEDDEHLASRFANLTLLDRVPDVARLRGRLDRASKVVPRLRRRVVESPARLAPPQWDLDPDFDIDRHFRVVELPAELRGPGGLERFVCILDARPLPRNRPLWEFVLVTGLPDGRAAMLQRLDHTIADGEAGLRMSMEFIDLQRDAPDPADPGTTPNQPTSPTGALGALSRAVSEGARRGAASTWTTVGELLDHVRHPTRVAATTGDVIEVASTLARQARSVDRRLSPLWTERSLDRSFAMVDVDFDAVRVFAHDTGSTVNDVFTTAVIEAAVQVHVAAGTTPTQFRAAVPISTRHGRRGGNFFAPTLCVLPADPAMSPRDRLTAIADVMTDVKHQGATDAVATLAPGARLVPKPLLTAAGRWITSNIDIVLSNVRAAPFDTFMAGALVESNHPLGPLTGAAVNVTTMSYRGRLDIGVHADVAAVDDSEALASAIDNAFESLMA